MNLMVIIFEAEEGATARSSLHSRLRDSGESFDELLRKIYEAVEVCLSVDMKEVEITEKAIVMEITV